MKVAGEYILQTKSTLTTNVTTGEIVPADLLVKPHAYAIIDKLKRHWRARQHLFVLENFYIGSWECDLFSVTQSGYSNEYEIKITVADYKQDFEKACGFVKKHDLIKEGKRTNRFWYVVPEGLINEVPEYAGLIYAKQLSENYFAFSTVKSAPVLHKTKLDDNIKLLKNIATKCYYRLPMDT